MGGGCYTYRVATSLSDPECSKRDDARSALPAKRTSFVLDYLELAFLPLALGGVVAGLTWVVWFLTVEPCTPELAKTTGCSLSSLGKYINLDLFNKMVVDGGVAGGFGGIGSYVMITRERHRADAAEQRALEERQARETERQAREEERQAWEEERQARERAEQQARERAEQQIEIERQRVDEARREADEARRQADEAKDLYIRKLEELVAQNHNGNPANSESS